MDHEAIDPREDQEALRARVRKGEVEPVFLDPDGTLPGDWLGLIVLRATGVVYENQCAGVATESRYAEGYYVPLGGARYDATGPIAVANLAAVFHHRGACDWRSGVDISEQRWMRLSRVVAQIPHWSGGGELARRPLVLDLDRRMSLAEAWIPVLTVSGPAVLVTSNCD